MTSTLCSLFALALSAAASAADRKPNVIVLLSDDAGFADFSMHGSATCPTPHIDSIAQRGVRFTDAYVSASVCSPSRAGLLTGRYQQRFGYDYNLRAGFGLPVEETTVADGMRAAGYKTIALGKWHLGMTPEYHPCARGFDEFYGFLGGQRSYWPDKKKATLLHNTEPIMAEFDYLTPHLAERACGYIEQFKDEPFFMYVAFNAVHTPMHATDSDMQTITGAANEKRRKLAAMTVSLDAAVGRILATLSALELEDDTLLIFTNDNGGAYINESNNWPLRGTKGTPFEGGIRVPFVMQWPGQLPSGAVCRLPIMTIDIFPTALAAAGIEPAQELDGVDLLPFLAANYDSPKAPHENLYWRKGPRCWAIRQGNWKLVGYQDHPLMLFDVVKDPGERFDVAAQHADIVASLKKEYETWNATLAEPLWQQHKMYEFVNEKLQQTHMRTEHPGHEEPRRVGEPTAFRPRPSLDDAGSDR